MTPPNTEITPSRHTPREILQECLESAVRVAFIRNDLEIDSDLEMTQQEVANDAACACFGEETESDEPIAEVSIALNRLEAFDDMLSALKAAVADRIDDEWLKNARKIIRKAEKQP